MSLIVIVVACALGACGGDDGGSDDAGKARQPSGDQQQVRAVLEEALTTKDPGACTRLLTQNLLEQLSSERGKAAVRACRQDSDHPGATSVSIDRVAVNGPRAGADVRPTGGSLTFKALTIGLRRSDGRWRLDRLKKATLDRPAFVAYSRKELTSPPNAFSGPTVGCMLHDIGTASDEQITRALLSADPRLFLLPITICGVRTVLARAGVRGRVAACVVGRVRHVLTTGVLGRRLRASSESAHKVVNSPQLERAVRRSAAACAPAAPGDGRYQPAAAYP